VDGGSDVDGRRRMKRIEAANQILLKRQNPSGLGTGRARF
jgi:hypothetical protein